MGLNDHGIVSIVQIVVYTPIALIAICLIFKHGFARDLGWIYLAIFSTVRIVGGVMIAVEQTESKPSSGLVTAALILQSVGLSPLLLATAGFLGIVAQHAKITLITPTIKRLTHLALIVALVISIVGVTDETSSDPSDQANGPKYRKAGSLLFLAMFLIFVVQHAYYWIHRNKILKHRRTLLLGISCALPWLLLRIIYSLGSAFSGTTSNHFSPLNGTFATYLILSVIPEFCAVLTYTCVGLLLPLGLDREEAFELQGASNENLQKAGGYPAAMPYPPYVVQGRQYQGNGYSAA